MVKVSIIGLGFVGLSLAVFLGSKNIKVTCVDIVQKKIECLKKNQPYFYEKDLTKYLKKAKKFLKFSTEIDDEVMNSDFIFVAVGTPLNGKGEINLDYVKEVISTISKKLPSKKTPIIIIKSTVTPGTVNQIIKPILTKKLLRDGIDFHVISNPEFLKEGSAINDTMYPHVIVVGGSNDYAMNKVIQFYKKIHPKNQKFVKTNNSTAEMIKYANNSFLATKISFINTISNICQKIPDTNVDDVAKVIGMDPRIGGLFLRAGPGYGGSCFPKDVQALINFSQKIGHNPILFKATQDTNTQQVNQIIKLLQKNLKAKKENSIGILGVSFKEDTDDIRESVSIELIRRLLRLNYKIKVHDPKALENVQKVFAKKITYCDNIYNAIEKTSAVILMTPWNEYRNIPEHDFLSMKNPLIIDTRRILNIKNNKIKYLALGIGN